MSRAPPNLRHKLREHRARPDLFEVSDALAEKEAHRVQPSHGVSNLIGERLVKEIGRVWESSEIRHDRNRRRSELEVRKEGPELPHGLVHVTRVKSGAHFEGNARTVACGLECRLSRDEVLTHAREHRLLR